MKSSSEPMKALQIFSMLFGATPEEREPMMSKALVEKRERDELVAAGLIRLERRGRANYMVLDQKAWDWAIDHLATPLPVTPKAGPILHNVLAKLAHFLQRHARSLDDFVRTAPEKSPSSAKVELTDGDLETQIRQLCLALGQGKPKERIRLKDLRPRLSVPRSTLDRALRDMQQRGALVLMRLDNPAELTTDDEAAALEIAGNPRHILYLEA